MNWQLKEGRFFLEGLEGVLAFTATRYFPVPAGKMQAAEIRSLIERWGIRPSAVVGMEQVHGGAVRTAEGSDTILPGCDGLVADRPGRLLAMRSADCLPIIVYDRSRRRIGLAHAGWRGVRAGLPAGLVRAIGSADLDAAIGPAIGPCCYEAGPEFEGWFPAYLKREGVRRMLDLKAAAVDQLVGAGVRRNRIAVAGWCTACSLENCSSYRREGACASRMLTCAMIELQQKENAAVSGG